jgi:hypothetical protein
LNVAITRAREALIVFGSLRSEHIDLSRTSAIGVAHLKQFLDFATHGASAFARAATGPLGDHESPFEAAVAERLSAKGWILHPQIGVSGFRIDLGVVDPDASGAFLAGIECDGATYHRGATARDRDRLRQVVLEGLGWRILRIWSTDWWTNAARECDRLHSALQAALAEKRAKTAVPDLDQSAAVLPEDEGDTAHDVADEDIATDPFEQSEQPPALSEDNARPDASHFYEDEYRETLRAIVLNEIIRWGPIRLDRLAQRVARLHGFQRTGREIQDRVSASIPGNCPRTKEAAGEFVWPQESNPTAWESFRPPEEEGETRDPGEIAMQELVALARLCSSRHHDQDAVLLAMRDACGLQKLREASRERFLDALRLITGG